MRHMDEEEIRMLIQKGRDFIRPVSEEDCDDDYETDQMQGKPQPPLVKEAQTDSQKIVLPVNFSDLEIKNDFLAVINHRESHRIYSERKMSLLQLSYLLWCTQGIKSIRGKKYATLRTVPCGGARHEFECYMAVNNVEGLANGFYHYLPMNHSLELLSEKEDLRVFISDSVEGQKWASKAGVVFYYSFVAYRAEWRYGIDAHRIVLVDAGHITANMYLAAESVGLGGCAIGAVNGRMCNEAFGLDGEEEYIFYAMPVGTYDAKDRAAEDEIYAFVKEQGL